MGMLLWRPGKTGDEEMIEYLISSYSDVININIQDKVSIEYYMYDDNECLYLLGCNYGLIVWMDCLESCSVL